MREQMIDGHLYALQKLTGRAQLRLSHHLGRGSAFDDVALDVMFDVEVDGPHRGRSRTALVDGKPLTRMWLDVDMQDQLAALNELVAFAIDVHLGAFLGAPDEPAPASEASIPGRCEE